MLTDRDITVRATAEGEDPTTIRVRDVMTPDVVYCFEDDLVSEAARLMANERAYEAWAYEIHHSTKKDAPSGTLWKLVEEMKKAGYGAQIDVSSSRAGAHPGTHEIGFDSAGDTITLRHVARSREGFAQGALRAAKWLVGKKGFYQFGDIVFR